jgi:DNA-binding MarR family transcriptional regulator
MQATGPSVAVSIPSSSEHPAGGSEQIPSATLTRDMYALASFLMRSSHVGTFNRIAELELSFTQIKALCTMDLDSSEPSVKGLAEAMKVSLPAMSRAVDGLHERGFVDRYEDPADRRMKRICLTESGRAVSATLNEARLIGMQAFLSSLSEAESDALGKALKLILAARPQIAALRPEETNLPVETDISAGTSLPTETGPSEERTEARSLPAAPSAETDPPARSGPADLPATEALSSQTAPAPSPSPQKGVTP